ncbi:MAG TPA: succinate dehydrogenase hydrophobic membrane anchor subunit [Thermomicrobiaceae bacterium]|nr:succinate dehydrogenase hydrophobic membrane anchor subunit [Thermomicrobiaceae bacterium]
MASTTTPNIPGNAVEAGEPRASSRTKRVGRERPRGGSNFELYSWYFFRISGVLLIFLVLTHVILLHVVTTVDDINYNFVVRRWASPFWRANDWLMLTLALLHGLNGARIAVDDYVGNRGWRVFSYSLLWGAAIIFFILGTIAIVTFNPHVAASGS